MNYLKVKSVLFFILILVSNSVGLDFGRNSSLNRNQQLKSQSDEIENYQYTLGFRLRVAFNNNCSFLFGTVDNFADSKVVLKIEEQLWGEKINDNNIILEYKVPRTDFRTRNEARSPWDYVDVNISKKLFVAYCHNSGGQRRNWVVISNPDFFTTVRQLITYHNQLEKDQNIILDAKQLLNRQNNLIFAGYISTYLQGRTFNNSENVALVSSELLGDKKASSVIWSNARLNLRRILTREGETSLSATMRDLVITRLVDVASGDNKASEQVISLMIDLSEKNKIDIKPFLNEEKRHKLLQNYQTFASKFASKPGREEFEKQLMEN